MDDYFDILEAFDGTSYLKVREMEGKTGRHMYSESPADHRMTPGGQGTPNIYITVAFEEEPDTTSYCSLHSALEMTRTTQMSQRQIQNWCDRSLLTR